MPRAGCALQHLASESRFVPHVGRSAHQVVLMLILLVLLIYKILHF